MHSRSCLAVLLIFAGSIPARTEAAEQTAPIRLQDPAGHVVEPLADQGQKATVLFFLTTDCPIGNGYAPEIARIAKEYAARAVRCFAIYANEPQAEITQHLSDYHLQLTAVCDPKLQLARLTGATVTPEVCVLNPGGTVLYRGRIDDRVVKLGTVRAEPRQRDLRLALDAVLAGRPVTEKVTKAIGCSLPTPANK